MSIDLEAIRARADTATPGPWKIGRQSPSGAQNVGTLHGILTAQTTSKENAAFIAHAREDIPALLAEVERQADEISSVTAERDAAIADIRQACTTCMHSGKPSCPWEGTYHHRGEHGEKIGVCNAWQWRGARKEQNNGN